MITIDDVIFEDSEINFELVGAIWYHMQMMVAHGVHLREGIGGSRPSRSRNISRDFQMAHRRIMEHYFWPVNQIRDDGSGEYGRLYPKRRFSVDFESCDRFLTVFLVLSFCTVISFLPEFGRMLQGDMVLHLYRKLLLP